MRTDDKLHEFGGNRPVKSILGQVEELSFMRRHGKF